VTIIKSEIIEDHPQAYGKRKIRYCFTDHLKRRHINSCDIDLKADTIQFLKDRQQKLEMQLKVLEISGVIKKMEQGASWYPLQFATKSELMIALNEAVLIGESDYNNAVTLKDNLDLETVKITAVK